MHHLVESESFKNTDIEFKRKKNCLVIWAEHMYSVSGPWLGLFDDFRLTPIINNVGHHGYGHSWLLLKEHFFCEKNWKTRQPWPVHPCFPEPLVMCTHTLIKMNARLKCFLKARWGGTVIKCRVAPQMGSTYSVFPRLICGQRCYDKPVGTVFPSHGCRLH